MNPNAWDLIRGIIKDDGLIPFQMQTVNYFVNHINQYIPAPLEIKCTKPRFPIPDCKDILHRFTISNPRFHKPKFAEPDSSLSHRLGYEKGDELHTLNPAEARARGLYYSSSFHVDIRHDLFARDENQKELARKSQFFEQVYIGEFPVMARSKLCILNEPSFKHGNDQLVHHQECYIDPGGAIIIGGVEKAIITQERLGANKIIVKMPKPGSNEFLAEVRSQSENTNLQTSQFLVKMSCPKSKSKGWYLECRLPYLDPWIPLLILMGALGIKDKNEALELILGDRADYKDEFVSAREDEENIMAGRPAKLAPEDYDRMANILSRDLGDFECFEEYQSTAGCLSYINNVAQHSTTMLDSMLRFFQDRKSELDNFKCTRDEMLAKLQTEYPDLAKKCLTRGLQDDPAEALQDLSEFCKQEIIDLEEKLKKKHLDNILTMLNKDFLPHMGNNASDFPKKLRYLGLMVKSLLLVTINKEEYVNRDFLTHKRLDTAGITIKGTILEMFRNMTRDLNTEAIRMGDFTTMTNIRNSMKKWQFLQAVKTILKKGIWGTPLNPNAKTGITNPKMTICLIASISLMNRISTSLAKKGKFPGPRKLVGNQAGMKCSTESPDTEAVGLQTNRSVLAACSFGSTSSALLPLLEKWVIPLDNVPFKDIHWKYKVFINGYWLGCTETPLELVLFLRNLRRKLSIHYQTGISLCHINKSVSIRTDQGRMMRPLLIVEQGKLNWDPNKKYRRGRYWGMFYFLQMQWIEYLDVEEIENTFIAMSPKEIQPDHTHCELHPSTWNGHIAGSTPLVHHSPTARLMFGNGMLKQACGAPNLNYKSLFPSVSKHLMYPQKPLVTTPIGKISGMCDLPIGQNFVVLVACVGDDQEDAIKMSERFRHFCGGSVIHTKTYKDEELKEGHKYREYFGLAKDDPITKTSIYKNVEEDGLPQPFDYFQKGDIVNAKYTETEFFSFETQEKERHQTDLSKENRATTDGGIKDVLLYGNASGTRSTKIKQISEEKPLGADKLTSFHTQKGVLCSFFMSAADAPYSKKTGITADIIINPAAFPSRMTVGQVLEGLAAKVAALYGKEISLAMFDSPEEGTSTLDFFEKELGSIGYEKTGLEEFVSGVTGEQLQSPLWIGIVGYATLKHFVKGKQHVRSTGPNQYLTRQPTEGRIRDGGGKFGEMERDAIAASGCPSSLRDRLHTRSDASAFWICNKCGQYGYPLGNLSDKIYCHYCQTTNDDIHLTSLPYATKVWMYYQQILLTSPRPKVSPMEKSLCIQQTV